MRLRSIRIPAANRCVIGGGGVVVAASNCGVAAASPVLITARHRGESAAGCV